MKKYTITEKQREQFNKMIVALKTIGNEYKTPTQLRRNSQNDWGLDFDEAIEMAYENMQVTAKSACKGVKYITGHTDSK